MLDTDKNIILLTGNQLRTEPLHLSLNDVDQIENSKFDEMIKNSHSKNSKKAGDRAQQDGAGQPRREADGAYEGLNQAARQKKQDEVSIPSTSGN